MTIKPISVHGNVVLVTNAEARVDLRSYHNLTIAEAHELLVELSEAIGQAQGFKDALEGKVSDVKSCRTCGSRNITQNHKCKRVKA